MRDERELYIGSLQVCDRCYKEMLFCDLTDVRDSQYLPFEYICGDCLDDLEEWAETRRSL